LQAVGLIRLFENLAVAYFLGHP